MFGAEAIIKVNDGLNARTASTFRPSLKAVMIALHSLMVAVAVEAR